MLCPHCRADTPIASGSCVVCSGHLPLASAGDRFTSRPADEGPTISSGGGHNIPEGATISSGVPGSVPEGATVSSGAPHGRTSSTSILGPGQLFAERYRIERLLGSGGMGAVYRAHDVELGVPVALKVIRSDILADPVTGRDFELRFKQELLLARKVTHQNVVRIHDLGESAGIKYITMPLIEGSDLHALLAQGPLPFERVVSLAQQIASGLAAAHDVGIIHRDLKPQNIMVDGSGRAYISDFGLAKSYEASTAGLTRKGDFIGTPKYIAPEIVEGHPADHRSDLYALGLILYEMASGILPFTGDSVMELLMQRVRKTPKDLREVNPAVPEFFSRIVMRCLAKEPAARYQHASEIVADIEAARPPAKSRAAQTISINLPLPTQRGWMAAGVVVLLLAGVVALPPVRNMVLPQATTAQNIPPASEKKLVAVLPFRVLGDRTVLEHLALGIPEALAARLFPLKDITVASSDAVRNVDLEQPIGRLARDLGVNLVMSGTVRGTGERLSVIVQLDDVVSGERLWTREFPGVAADLLTLEDRIFTGAVEALGLRPSDEERAARASRPTENIEAYEQYLKGRNAMRGQHDPRNVEAAIGFYEAALRSDTRFALAYAGIANAALQMYRETRERLWADKAVSAAEQAKALDDDSAEVLFAVGNTYQATGRTAEAIAELKRALVLAPNSDEGYRRLGRAYLRAGRSDDAIDAYLKAIEINPYYWVNHNAIGAAYLQLGEYEKAIAANSRVIELEPDNVNGHNDLGAAYLYVGRFQDASVAFGKALKALPTPETYTNLGIAHYYSGDYASAVPMFEKAVELSPGSGQFVGNLADGYRLAGRKDEALATYDRAIAAAYKDLQVNPQNAMAKCMLALYYARKDDPTTAKRFIDEARATDADNVSILFAKSQVDAMAGRPEDAVKALDAALKAGYPVTFAANDPDLATLRSDPGFARLMRQHAPAGTPSGAHQ